MRNIQKNDLHIGVISDITLEPFFSSLIRSYFGESTIIYFIPYGEHNGHEYKKCLKDSNILIVWLTLESSYSNMCDAFNLQFMPEQEKKKEVIASCKILLSDLLAYSNACILWFLFEDYFSKASITMGYRYSEIINRLNIELNAALQNNVIFIDLKRLIAEVGIANAYDSKGRYRWNAPYSKALIEVAVKEIHKEYLIEQGITKKCLVLDCDNVLWGGILSEDGIENIKLGGNSFGREYQDFQKFLLSLFYHGVILTVCSKNDVSDIMTMFREHSGMILKEEHIACYRVNWGNKCDNIKQIAEELNISLNSIVFVDDSPIEIETVKALLPEVTAILYERDMVYDKLSCFNLKSNVNILDIEKRNETYRTNSSREILKAQCESYEKYIAALESIIDIHEAKPIEYNRIAELTQRINKCTNGKRYIATQIQEHASRKKVKQYTISVSDRFSDLGLVGAVEVEDDTLTLFCLSCRALGRGLEDKMLMVIGREHQINNIEYQFTGRNEAMKMRFIEAFPDARIIER